MDKQLFIKIIYIFIFLIFIKPFSLLAQSTTMHDFTVTDTDNEVHRLYADYLDQNKVVVIKFFFTTCPPCIAISPQWQAKYVQQGSGQQGVEFMEVTTSSTDTNAKVKQFKNSLNLTMIGVGVDGNSRTVIDPFQNGDYGSWWGTPAFAVIAPNRRLFYAVQLADLDARIAEAKLLTVSSAPSTSYNLNITSDLTIPDGHVKYFVKPANAPAPKIEITKNAQGNYTFQYPSASVPQMSNPVLEIQSFGPAYTTALTAADLFLIQRHILGLVNLSPSYRLAAGDANSDGRLTAADLSLIQRVILGLITTFPGASYLSLPSSVPLVPSPGNTASLDLRVFKVGNVN